MAGVRRLEVVFSGRVQGVGFRATTRATARRFPVTGWVRNEPDGTVRAQFQGDPVEVDRCLGAIAEAMPGHIGSAVRREVDAVPDESGFEIRR
jgi:acylphosphatase